MSQFSFILECDIWFIWFYLISWQWFFQISGCGLLGVGLWLRIAYECYASLLPQYALMSADSLAIAVGTIAFTLSFCACCGSWFQNRCLLITVSSNIIVYLYSNYNMVVYLLDRQLVQVLDRINSTQTLKTTWQKE